MNEFCSEVSFHFIKQLATLTEVFEMDKLFVTP